MVETFARATGLIRTEVATLTLASLSDCYPVLDPAFTGRQRHLQGIAIKETWVFFRATRYCPDCLAGDGSPIQNRHGGPGKLHRRLPIVFACPAHQRLPEHTCPCCRHPIHNRTGPESNSFPWPGRKPCIPRSAAPRFPSTTPATGTAPAASGSTPAQPTIVWRPTGSVHCWICKRA